MINDIPLIDLIKIAKEHNLTQLKYGHIEFHITLKEKISFTPEEIKQNEDWIKKYQDLNKPITDEEILFGKR